MYDSEPLESSKSRTPMLRLRRPGAAEWLPLQQDWSTRWTTLSESLKRICSDHIGSFETRTDDVFIVTFMKCGTTWMQELAWLLLNNLDYEASNATNIWHRSVFLEYNAIVPHYDSIAAANELPSPRLLKSHLPAQLLPSEVWQQRRKMIYVARNIKDVVVSSWHFLSTLIGNIGNIENYVDNFISNQVMYTSYWEHIVDFWRMRNEPNIFFVTYEEMKRDLRGVIERLCIFLERPDLSKIEMEQLLKHLSFDNMKGNKSTNPTEFLREQEEVDNNYDFMRRGIVGSYKDELSPALKEKIDNHTRNFLAQYGLTESDIFEQI